MTHLEEYWTDRNNVNCRHTHLSFILNNYHSTGHSKDSKCSLKWNYFQGFWFLLGLLWSVLDWTNNRTHEVKPEDLQTQSSGSGILKVRRILWIYLRRIEFWNRSFTTLSISWISYSFSKCREIAPYSYSFFTSWHMILCNEYLLTNLYVDCSWLTANFWNLV